MKKYKELLLWVIFIMMFICVLTPLIYWIFHPKMTHMEIFVQFWPVYIPVVSMYIINKKLLKL